MPRDDWCDLALDRGVHRTWPIVVNKSALKVELACPSDDRLRNEGLNYRAIRTCARTSVTAHSRNAAMLNAKPSVQTPAQPVRVNT